MWKLIAIIALAFPLAFALENIRLEVRAMRERRGKPVRQELTDEEKFDNWSLDNEEQKQKVEEKKNAKRIKKEEKLQRKKQIQNKRNETQNQKTINEENEMKL